GAIFPPPVASRLALLRAGPAQAGARVAYPFNVGVGCQHADAVSITMAGRRQVNVKEPALALAINAGAGFQPDGLTKDHVLPIQAFYPDAVIAVHTDGVAARSCSTFRHLHPDCQ